MEPTDTTQGRQPSALVSFLCSVPQPSPHARLISTPFLRSPLLSTRLGHRQPFSFLSRLARGENARAGRVRRRGAGSRTRRAAPAWLAVVSWPTRALRPCGRPPLLFFFGLSFSPASPFFPFISTCSSGWFLRFPCLPPPRTQRANPNQRPPDAAPANYERARLPLVAMNSPSSPFFSPFFLSFCCTLDGRFARLVGT